MNYVQRLIVPNSQYVIQRVIYFIMCVYSTTNIYWATTKGQNWSYHSREEGWLLLSKSFIPVGASAKSQQNLSKIVKKPK